MSATVSRRDFIKWLTLSTCAVEVTSCTFPIVPRSSFAKDSEKSLTFELPALPYPYNGLAPRISEQIMKYHHDVHFASYINNLNTAISELPNPTLITDDKSLKYCLSNLSLIPTEFQTRIRNNGGGYLNHKLFFSVLSPQPKPLATGSSLSASINNKFGSMEAFKQELLSEAASLFGSGFTWLVVDQKGQLSIVKTPNQDNPVMKGLLPVLPCDCWEHAWYSEYGPKKKDYFAQWWECIDWPSVEQVYISSLSPRRA